MRKEIYSSGKETESIVILHFMRDVFTRYDGDLPEGGGQFHLGTGKVTLG